MHSSFKYQGFLSTPSCTESLATISKDCWSERLQLTLSEPPAPDNRMLGVPKQVAEILRKWGAHNGSQPLLAGPERLPSFLSPTTEGLGKAGSASGGQGCLLIREVL